MSGVPLRDVVPQLPWNIILIHTGSLWLSAAVRDSGLALWLVSSYTKGRFRDMTDIWQLLVILAVVSLVNEGGQESSALSAQLVPAASDMGLEIQANPLYFAVPVAAACYLPVMTPFCHLGLAFIYEHTAASFSEMALLGLFLKVVTTIALTLSSSAYFSFQPKAENDTQTTFIPL
ncbi:solute carrier family 13 member 2-like [Amblyomma americanum]